MNEMLWDEEELSKRLNIPRATLKAMRIRPDMDGPPYLKIGRLVRYSPSAVEKWLNGKSVDLRKTARR